MLNNNLGRDELLTVHKPLDSAEATLASWQLCPFQLMTAPSPAP